MIELALNVKLLPLHRLQVNTTDGIAWEGECSWLATTIDNKTLLVYSRYAGARPRRFDVSTITKLKCFYTGE